VWTGELECKWSFKKHFFLWKTWKRNRLWIEKGVRVSVYMYSKETEACIHTNFVHMTSKTCKFWRFFAPIHPLLSPTPTLTITLMQLKSLYCVKQFYCDQMMAKEWREWRLAFRNPFIDFWFKKKINWFCHQYYL